MEVVNVTDNLCVAKISTYTSYSHWIRSLLLDIYVVWTIFVAEAHSVTETSTMEVLIRLFQQFPDDIVNTICSRCDIHCLDYLLDNPNHQIFFQDFLGFRYTMRILGGGPHVSVKVGHSALASLGGICHCVTFHINLIYQEWSRRQALGLEQPTCYDLSFR